MSKSKINIERWNDNFKLDTTILLVGKRGSGKTSLLKQLLFNIRNKVDVCIAMTPTISTQKDLSKILPSEFIYPSWNEKVIKNLFEQQKKMLKKGSAIKHVCLVCDDLMYDKKLMRGKTMREIFQNGRHYHITLICTAQYLFDLDPSQRSNTDICLCLAENVHSNKEKLFKTFFGFFENYRDFDSVFRACTEDYEALVMDLCNNPTSNNLSHTVFWYKANLALPPFKVGNPAYFLISNKMNNRQSKDNSTLITTDQSTYRPRRRNIKVVTKSDEYGNRVKAKTTRTFYK